MEFSLKEILNLFRKRLIIIILFTLGGSGSLFIINHDILKPSYTASVQMYVKPNDISTSADLNDLYYAQKVVPTYIGFLKTKVFYSRVLDASKLNYTIEQLGNMTKITTVNNTEIFQISVTTHSSEESHQLASTMQVIAPKMIQEIKSTAEINVVDPVSYPKEPSGPNVIRNTVAGGVLGLLISIGLILLWELLDVNLKSKEELISKYQKPILGEIPSFSVNPTNQLLLRLRKLLFFRKNKVQSDQSILSEERKFEINESYKELRTNLRYTLYKEGCKKILINSPIPEDGKTTTCLNIGITLAQTGARVLLLDSDLRKGKLHSFFQIKSRPGLSEILSGILAEKEVIQNTNQANLQIITMGSIPPNPVELLAGSQMEELLKRLEKNYDYIIIDSPPVNIVSDALTLIKQVDGVIIVVKENRTTHPNIASAITKYELVNANILGFVVTAITSDQDSGKKSNYYYSH